jgi:1-acyl-sn-glycerol-3-phosphate acyltransferase
LSSNIDHLVGIVTSALPEAISENAAAPLSALLKNNYGESEIGEFLKVLETHGSDWGYHACHPTAAHLIKVVIKSLFGIRPIQGIENAKKALAIAQAGGRVVMLGNHLSYGDANYLQSQLELQGLEGFPLMVMAGPKVYRDPFRRLSSMSFDTLKMAQPPSRASEGAEVSMRELAEITRRVIKDAEEYQNKGRILYFFPEGSRSRTGGLQHFIPASARYCNQPGTVVFPVGFSGTDGLMGVTGDRIRLEDAKASIGPAVIFDNVVDQLPTNPSEQRKAWMDLLGFAVASQLPPNLRGVYSEESVANGEMTDWRYCLGHN